MIIYPGLGYVPPGGGFPDTGGGGAGGSGGGSNKGDIWKTIVGGSIFDFFQTKTQLDIASKWGYVPPYMVGAQPGGQQSGSLVPIVMVGGAIVLAIVLMQGKK